MIENNIKQELLERINAYSIDSKNGRVYNIEGIDEKYPSITTILSKSKVDSIKKWEDKVGIEEANRIKTEAANRGTILHATLENWLRLEPIDIKSNIMSVLKCSNMNLQYSTEYGVNRISSLLSKKLTTIRAVEQALYSKELKVAGRVDLIGDWEGELSIIDFKTSTKKKKVEWITDYFYQTSFYAKCLNELYSMEVKKIIIIIYNSDNSVDVFIRNPKDYYEGMTDTINKYWYQP